VTCFYSITADVLKGSLIIPSLLDSLQASLVEGACGMVMSEAAPAPLPGRGWGRAPASGGGAALTPGYPPPPLRGGLARVQNNDAQPAILVEEV